jgi:hypothetical protein
MNAPPAPATTLASPPQAWARWLSRHARLLRLMLLGYVLKTALLGAAWYYVPDLPQRAQTHMTAIWNWIVQK